VIFQFIVKVNGDHHVSTHPSNGCMPLTTRLGGPFTVRPTLSDVVNRIGMDSVTMPLPN
jgi:hypothetical protein